MDVDTEAPTLDTLLAFLYALPVAAYRMDETGEVSLLTPQATALFRSCGLSPARPHGWQLLERFDAHVAAQARAHALAPGEVVSGRQVGTHRLHVRVLEPRQWLVCLFDAA